MENKTKKKMVAFELPEDQYNKLADIAKSNFRTLSAELRMMVTSYLACMEETNTDE